MSARSYLYVPGDRPEMLAKSGGRGADALIVDLEDAVPPARKQEAREAVAEWLGSDARPGRIWIRINNDASLEDDVAAVAGRGIDGIVLPKTRGADDIERLRAAHAAALPVCALIETADGVLDARQIAMTPGVARLALGEADLGAELGIDASGGAPEWSAIRSHIVLVSAAAGIEPPVGPVETALGDAVPLRATTEALRRMGFGSRAAIHPSQVAVINEVFTPSESDVTAARALLAAARAHGGGAFRSEERMVDEAVLRSARRTLGRAGIDPESVEAEPQT